MSEGNVALGNGEMGEIECAVSSVSEYNGPPRMTIGLDVCSRWCSEDPLLLWSLRARRRLFDDVIPAPPWSCNWPEASETLVDGFAALEPCFFVDVGADGGPPLPDFGLLGPRTRPSLAYSQTRLRAIHRLHEGCSPLHCMDQTPRGQRSRRAIRVNTDFSFPRATLFACLSRSQSWMFWSAVEYACGWV